MLWWALAVIGILIAVAVGLVCVGAARLAQGDKDEDDE